MPASIVLSNIAWSMPDGRSVFADLDLTFGAERTGLVGRNGVGKTTLLKVIAGEAIPRTGTVSVTGRWAVLRHAAGSAPGETIADLFGVRAALAVLARAEAGEATAEDLTAADWSLEARIVEALARVGLEATAETPLETLSGGQRTRAALAALLIDEPDGLILDEPTNNLDREGRAAVIALLDGWRGGAVVVSHDRELLEVMDATVELTSLGATRYGGGWSVYRERKAAELVAARQALDDADRQLATLNRTAQAAAEKKARKDGAGQRKAARGDQPRILLGMMKERAEGTGGEQARLAQKRRDQATMAAAEARERIEVLQPLTVALPPTGLAAGLTVLTLSAVTAGYEPGRPVLERLDLTIVGPERVAVIGPNGAGKTTLLDVIAGDLVPWSGTVRVGVPTTRLDQMVSVLDAALSIRDNFVRLNPEADENGCRAALARFMFRADAALQLVGTLSGGQRLRAGLACVLGGAIPPQLLILDEPTNHLDIESIEAVEAGLRAYDGALLIVSHDEAFLEAVGVTRRVDIGRASLTDC